jgi:ABC-type transport system substrate-binding protein
MPRAPHQPQAIPTIYNTQTTYQQICSTIVQTFAAVGIKVQAQDPLVLSHAQDLYTKFQYLYPGASREFLELRILGALQRQLNDDKNPPV